MFAIVTMICIPLYFIYASGVGGGGSFMEDDSFWISKFTLGNMGGASTFCGHFRLGKQDADISCPIHTVVDVSNAIFGVMASDLESKQFCH
jgi:hypothetical protein